MSYLSVVFLWFISLLLSINTLYAGDESFTHLTQTTSELAQSDSGKMEIQTTLKQDINFKSHLEFLPAETNVVDSVLKDIHLQLSQINDSVGYSYKLFKQELLTDVELMRKEKYLEAKASLFYPVFSIISLVFLLVFRARGQPIWVSIFGLTLVACIVLTLINLSEIFKYFMMDDFSVLNTILQKH